MSGIEKISTEVQRLLNRLELRLKDVSSSAKKSGQKPEQVELSRRGKELAHLLAVACEKIRNMPDIRQEKVKEVAEKLKSGYYDRPEVYEKVADELIRHGAVL